MSTTREIREKSDVDLLARKDELKREIFKLKSLQAPENRDQSSAKARGYKKEIARIETILREREIEQFLNQLFNLESARG